MKENTSVTELRSFGIFELACLVGRGFPKSKGSWRARALVMKSGTFP